MERADTKTRVVVADDHPIVREGLAAVIARAPDMRVAGIATNGREAVEQSRLHSADVVLMDIRMPVLDGIEATSILRKQCPSTRVIILTALGGDDDIHKALRAGALAYLLKDADSEEILSAIRHLRAGRRPVITPEVSDRLLARFESDDLTLRERDILVLVVRGLKNRAIAETLGITEGTVKGHMNHVLDKLGAGNRTEAVTIAVRRGIVRLD